MPLLLRRGLIGFLDAIRWILSLSCKIIDGLNSLLTVALFFLRFERRDSDIFIVAYPRSGTTWIQMILYQLTTDGEMNFPHISEKFPWFERAIRRDFLKARFAIGKDKIDFNSLPSPRVFKTHLPYKRIPKYPCKYIYVARDGKDVAVSYYHLYRDILNYTGDFSSFFYERFLEGKVQYGLWFRHVHDWWENPKKLNVLFLTYEQLKNKPRETIESIARFCELDLDERRLSRVLDRCDFSFMKEHETKFEHASEVLWELGLRRGGFIRHGKIGEGKKALDKRMTAQYQTHYEKWLGRTSLKEFLSPFATETAPLPQSQKTAEHPDRPRTK
jgi:hypothetical protein